MRCLTLCSHSTDSARGGDDNVATLANEVTETHNDAGIVAPTTVSRADNDKKKNGSIGEARENYKFDVCIL